MTDLFNPVSLEDQYQYLVSHLPQGKMWSNAFRPYDDEHIDYTGLFILGDATQGVLGSEYVLGSPTIIENNFGKLFFALAVEFYRFQVLENKAYNEMDINVTDELLTDWEKSVGIPDSCFSTDVTDTERRNQVYQKFSRFGGVQTADDIVRVSLLFGFTVTAVPGPSVHTITVTISGGTGPATTFPLPFPMPFGESSDDFLKCILDKLVPANVEVIID